MTDLGTRLTQEFGTRFHRAPVLVVAPGRINLIGEHVDYNEGFVLPAAIDKQLVFAIAPNESDRCSIYSVDFKETASFSFNELKPGNQWVNYLMGVAEGFRQHGIHLGGIDCVFGGTIPAGAGLSSSAALCCGFAFALDHIHKANLSRLDLARIAQFSEHEFAGVKCGLMDQYAVLFGELDSVLLLDCRSMTHEAIQFPTSACSIMLVDTHVKHSLASTAYNDRRASCEAGIAILSGLFPGVQSLRDISTAQLEACQELLPTDVFSRCHFITEEIVRTQQAARALKGDDLPAFGQMMFASHVGLRDSYEVSCAELDLLVSVAEKNPECVIGARLMGGGFGGCTINLIRPGMEGAFKELISTEYFTSFRVAPEFYPVSLSLGTHLIN